jgi:hypothetical protein
METQRVHTVQLYIGDYIEAWHKGKLFHRGRVTHLVPALDLFWILDARTGTRRLLDPEALEIVLVEEPPARTPSGASPGSPERGAEPMPA